MKTEEIAKFREVLKNHSISKSGCEYMLDSYELQRECIAELVEVLNKASHGLEAAGYGRQKYIEAALVHAAELLGDEKQIDQPAHTEGHIDCPACDLNRWELLRKERAQRADRHTEGK